MVKHQPLQLYEKQLCLSCLTGIYGCRWKRYQRSHDNSTGWECLWLLILCATFFLLLICVYFWWAARNDYSELNWLLYNSSAEWTCASVSIVTGTATGFTYVAFLMVLALCHIAVGQQLNLYWLHKVGVVAVLLGTVAGFVYVNRLWSEEWNTALLSLQVTGPFLHIGTLAAVTVLAWLVAGQAVRAERTNSQVALLLTYLAVLLVLYLVPLTISSPCLMDQSSLKPRPVVVGRRGAPMGSEDLRAAMLLASVPSLPHRTSSGCPGNTVGYELAPENTLMSFHKALQQKVSGLEADVAISLDGIPFLMRENSLQRTTDVQKLFPKRQWDDASSFSWPELSNLNAGRWFLRDDPFWTVQSMSLEEQSWASNQTVCSLEELLQLAARANCSVGFRLQRPPPGHPRHRTWLNDTLLTVLRSGILQKQVMWTPSWERETVRQVASGFQQTSEEKLPTEGLREQGILRLDLRYDQVTAADLGELSRNNISVTLYTVNTPWLYSVLWCSGVPSVSSDAPHILRNVPYPIWIMSPDEYCFIWVTSDLVSFVIVIGIFVFQKWRLSGMHSYNPEQIMLNAAARRPSRDVSLMKEKLIFSAHMLDERAQEFIPCVHCYAFNHVNEEIDNSVGSSEELSLCTENGFDCYTDDGTTR